MTRPWAFRHLASDDLAQLAMVNLHHLTARSSKTAESYGQQLEGILCEFQARVQELNQELDLNLAPQGGWQGRVR